MADPVMMNFKVPPELANSIMRESASFDVSKSEYLRQCIRLGMPLLRGVPGLLDADEKRIAHLTEKCGKILVILEKD